MTISKNIDFYWINRGELKNINLIGKQARICSEDDGVYFYRFTYTDNREPPQVKDLVKTPIFLYEDN